MKVELNSAIAAGVGGVFRSHPPLPERLSPVSKDLRIVQVRLSAARDKNAFLNAVAGALAFPAHFGHNWDAFYDCLLDIDPGAGGLLIDFRHASGFARTEPEEFATARDTLIDAVDYWKAEGRMLLAIFELEAPALAPELREISCRAT